MFYVTGCEETNSRPELEDWPCCGPVKYGPGPVSTIKNLVFSSAASQTQNCFFTARQCYYKKKKSFMSLKSSIQRWKPYWLPNIVGNPNHGFDWFLTSWNWLGNQWSKCGLVTSLTGTEPDFSNTTTKAQFGIPVRRGLGLVRLWLVSWSPSQSPQSCRGTLALERSPWVHRYTCRQVYSS